MRSRAALKNSFRSAMLALTVAAWPANSARGQNAEPPSRRTTNPAAADCDCPKVASNRAPQAIQLLPERYNTGPLRLKTGKLCSITAIATDPDGDPLSWSVSGTPPGATFSPMTQQLSWTPGPSEIGEHVLLLRASDGEHEVTRAIQLEVYQNRSPSFFDRSYQVTVGQRARLVFWAEDPDGDSLSYSLARLPPGASFDPTSGILSWRPGPEATGTLPLMVTVTDGSDSVTRRFEIEVRRAGNRAWARFFMPGTAATLYAPRAPETGLFVGGALRVNLMSWIHLTDQPGPSHGQVYARAELAESSQPDLAALFSYAFGFSLSVERNPQRRYLIPIYGLELGGLVHRTLGSPLQTTPYAGLHLYAVPELFVSVRGGYRLVPARPERLSGPEGSLAVDLNLW